MTSVAALQDTEATELELIETARRDVQRLLDASLGDSSARFCQRVAEMLSGTCGVSRALVATPDESDAGIARTQGAASRGRAIDNFCYRITGSPCALVYGGELQYFASNVRDHFPEDADLEALRAESYLGLPLQSPQGEPIGLLVLLHDAPLPCPRFAKELLRTIGPHVGAALERERAARELQRGEALLRGLMQHSPVAMAVTQFEAPYRIFELNNHFTRLFGWRGADVATLTDWWPLAYPDPTYRARALAAWERALDALRLDPLARQRGLFAEVQCRDGSAREVEIDCSRYGDRALFILHDLAERRTLESAYLEASQRERERLASEVHDGLGQQLTGLSLMASAIAAQAQRGERVDAGSLQRLALIASDAVTQCRAVSHGLMPLNEARGNLAGALAALATSVNSGTTAVSFALEADATLALPPESSDHLYRIAQEALTNALRHAQATRIQLRLRVSDYEVELEIGDDGRGPAAGLQTSSGLGLQTMRFRAAALRGRLSIQAAKQGGTVLRCTCPNRGVNRATSPSR
jgi:signal transduction histidine kinase